MPSIDDCASQSGGSNGRCVDGISVVLAKMDLKKPSQTLARNSVEASMIALPIIENQAEL